MRARTTQRREPDHKERIEAHKRRIQGEMKRQATLKATKTQPSTNGIYPWPPASTS